MRTLKVQKNHKGNLDMKRKVWWKKYSSLVFVGGAIPILIILGNLFNWPMRAIIPVVVILSLIFAALALWIYANRNADGSEWWQDESASGWRGY